ncbi:MAG: hypothetical protein KGV57_00330 [Fusobacterium sp.]|nr:hypothetical protein [Fusobacterium sp.]
MKNIFNNKFIVKHQDMYGEKYFEIVKGNVFLENNNRKYMYQSKFGFCELSLKDKIINIIRENNNFKIKFNGEKNKCLYKTENFEYYLFFLGKNYSYDEEQKIFSVVYEIYDINNEKLNEINFSIKEI